MTAGYIRFLLGLLCFFSLVLNLSADNKISALANLPLYLSLIEFSQPNAEVLAEAKLKLQEKKAIELKKNLTLNPFHQRNGQTLEEKTAVSKQSFCGSCHLPLPHQKNLSSRAFNNMHSRYIACETCHFDSEKLPRQEQLSYQWYDHNRRTAVDANASLFKMDKGQWQKNIDSHIKITPFYDGQAAIITRQHLYVEKLMESWEKADINLKAKLKVRTHLPLKEEGFECMQCHNKHDGILELASLGADSEQIRQFQNNIITQFFKRYGKSGDHLPDRKQAGSKEIERIRINDLLR